VLQAVRGPDGQVVDFTHELVNARAQANARQQLLGQTHHEAYPPERGSLFEQFCQVLTSGKSRSWHVDLPDHPDPAVSGRAYDVFVAPADGDRLVCRYRDTTEYDQAQHALREQALKDPLTGLPNRRLLLDHVQHAVARLQRHRSVVALLFCDLDAFKAVNDTHGHAAGDDLLMQVAHRLRAAVRPEDVVARLGGDEFVVVCEDIGEQSAALSLATRVRDAVIGAYVVRGVEMTIGMSVGVATTDTLRPVRELLAAADAALYVAKRPGNAPIALA
jgi:diguanylate cyclase (GGDEF)-like protein